MAEPTPIKREQSGVKETIVSDKKKHKEEKKKHKKDKKEKKQRKKEKREQKRERKKRRRSSISEGEGEGSLSSSKRHTKTEEDPDNGNSEEINIKNDTNIDWLTNDDVRNESDGKNGADLFDETDRSSSEEDDGETEKISVTSDKRSVHWPDGGLRNDALSSSGKASASKNISKQIFTFDPKRPIQIIAKKTNPTVDPIVASFPSGLPFDKKITNEHDNHDKIVQQSSCNFTLQREENASNLLLIGKDDSCLYESQAQEQHKIQPPISSQKRQRQQRESSSPMRKKGATSTGATFLTKQLVGIYDKKTQTLQLYKTNPNGSIYIMKQTIHSHSSDSASNNIDTANNTNADRYRMLFESFGSVKKQKVIRSREANKVTIDSVVGADTAVANSNVKNETVGDGENHDDDNQPINALEDSIMEARKSFLPPFDESATHPSDIYNAELIAGPEMWNQTHQVLHAISKQYSQDGGTSNWYRALTAREEWPRSLNTLLENMLHHQQQLSSSRSNGIKSIMDKSINKRLRTIMVLRHCMTFHTFVTTNRFPLRGTHRDISHKLKLPELCTPRLLELFTSCASGDISNNGLNMETYTITKQLRDKRLVYILILYLMAASDVCGGDDTATTMKISSIRPFLLDLTSNLKEATLLLNEAGCKTKYVRIREGSHVVKQELDGDDDNDGDVLEYNGGLDLSVSLICPLTFPPPKRRRG